MCHWAGAGKSLSEGVEQREKFNTGKRGSLGPQEGGRDPQRFAGKPVTVT